MNIIQAQDTFHISKPNGADVYYYLFKDYEVHYNEQQLHTIQDWHHHEKIWETIFIIDGCLTIHWREDTQEKTQWLRTGDLVETGHTPHTLSNHTDDVAKFLVIKRMPSDEDYREIFKNDKVLD